MVDLRCVMRDGAFARWREGCALRCCGRASGAALARRRGECTRFMPGIACGRCYGRAQQSQRCADPPASMQPSLKARCCGVASPDEQRAAGRATAAPSPRRRASLFLQSCRVALSVLHDSLFVALPCNDERHRGPNVSRQSARTGVIALLYRSVYRVKEPRQQPNENSQRGPRPRVGIVVGHGERTQVNDSKLTHRLLW